MRITAPRVQKRSSIVSFLLATAAALSSATAGAEEGFPYIAYVARHEAQVRSGPDAAHYVTGRLQVGFAVEVYRHDGEGWCAIRPPDGSFSLAPAKQLRVIDGQTAEVLASGVVVRVGGDDSAPSDAVQVLLNRGEIVHLVEPPKPNSPWAKITPPAGEFRWIAARQLSRTPPVEGATSADAASTWQPEAKLPGDSSEAPATSADDFEHLLEAPEASDVAVIRTDGSLWQSNAPAGQVRVAGGAAGLEQPIRVVPGSPASILLAQHQQPVEGGAADETSTSGQPRIRFRSLSTQGPIDSRVAEMHVKLSSIVAHPPGSWQLQPLREEATALLAAEKSSVVRRQLRDLVERVATFESIQQRRLAVGSGLPAAPLAQAAPADSSAKTPANPQDPKAEMLARIRSDLGVDPTITPTPGGPTPPPVTEALYDAVGTLKPVVSRRSQAPRYALVDDHGDVVTFVTAPTDVNLQAYVGKRIGVSGARGFMPEYRRAHVTASRVTPLEERLTR